MAKSLKCRQSPLFANENVNIIDVGSVVWVFVTHINNPHSFYVRLLENNSQLELVEDAGPRLSRLEIQLRSVVIYQSKLLNKNIRGQVYNMKRYGNFTLCDVFAVDYGFSEKCLAHHMFQPNCGTFIPPLALHCRLANCEPIGGAWTPEATETMKYFCNSNEKTKMTVISNSFDSFAVDLINSCPDDISTMLAYAGCSTFGYVGNAVNRIEVPVPSIRYFTYKRLTANSAMQVRLQYGKVLETFYVADPVDYLEYVSDRKMLTVRMVKERYLTQEEMVCGAAVALRVDGVVQYERAVIIKVTVPNARALVQLVDWGSIKDVALESLKPLPDFFLQKPAMALYCCLHPRTIPVMALRRFINPGYQLNIRVLEPGDGFRRPNIVAITSF